MSERVPCQTPDCTATILPATAAKTGGLCMPCHQQKLAEEHKAYIAQHRRDVDRYAGVSDPVEILKLMHAPRVYDPLVQELPYPKSARQLYRQLTVAEQERMESYAIEQLEQGDEDQAELILLSLASFAGARIERGLEAMYREERYDPGILYKQASPAIRDALISRVEQDAASRNLLLLALAWIGDEEVVRLFAGWRQHPPSWAGQLHVPPEWYAREAGWELDADGHKRLLFYPESYHFEVDPSERIAGSELGEASHLSPPATALQAGEHHCPWCGSQLAILLDYRLQAPLLRSLDLPGQRLRIAACLHCAAYKPVYTRVDGAGGYAWSEYNIAPDPLPTATPDEARPRHALRLSEQPRDAYDGAWWLLEAPTSKIGGHPTWVQDADYPACPCCSETMRFIGQVDLEQAADSEGIYYAFVCSPCQHAAVQYQQS